MGSIGIWQLTLSDPGSYRRTGQWDGQPPAVEGGFGRVRAGLQSLPHALQRRPLGDTAVHPQDSGECCTLHHRSQCGQNKGEIILVWAIWISPSPKNRTFVGFSCLRKSECWGRAIGVHSGLALPVAWSEVNPCTNSLKCLVNTLHLPWIVIVIHISLRPCPCWVNCWVHWFPASRDRYIFHTPTSLLTFLTRWKKRWGCCRRHNKKLLLGFCSLDRCVFRPSGHGTGLSVWTFRWMWSLLNVCKWRIFENFVRRI